MDTTIVKLINESLSQLDDKLNATSQSSMWWDNTIVHILIGAALTIIGQIVIEFLKRITSNRKRKQELISHWES